MSFTNGLVASSRLQDVEARSLDPAPIYHQREERVNAHVLVCFLAYTMYRTLDRVAETKSVGLRPERSSPHSALAREMNIAETAIAALAFETGLRQLWRERTLRRYPRGQISRERPSSSGASNGSISRIVSTR
jgi:hypothetical protein